MLYHASAHLASRNPYNIAARGKATCRRGDRSTKLSYTPCSARDLTRSRPKRIQNLGSACARQPVGKSVLAINLFWSERAFRTFYVYVMSARRRSNHSNENFFPSLCNHLLYSIQDPLRAGTLAAGEE